MSIPERTEAQNDKAFRLMLTERMYAAGTPKKRSGGRIN